MPYWHLLFMFGYVYFISLGIQHDYYFSHMGTYSFLIVYFTEFVKCKRGLYLCDINII